ncbi:hypothetical protein PENSPDRAFT_588890 [Peniophora sp. CONT]|nr:hypothetical protein PENSPDRAFT_588890 [Peniophora sp. CONT]
MSSDLVDVEGPSIIQSHAKQRGPLGARAILGPLRYGNHDCRPNAVFYAIHDSNAYVLAVERQIRKGEQITVKYSKEGYYRSRCLCFSCTGELTTQLQRPKRAADDAAEVEPSRPKKKIRRGLKSRLDVPSSM